MSIAAPKPLHIAIFTDSFLPMISGVVTAVLTLAEGLADRGNRVLIVYPGGGGTRSKGRSEPYRYPNIRTASIAALPAHFYQDFRWASPFSLKIREIVKEERIDLVHFMTPFLVSFVGINIARGLGIPVIGTFHTFISDPANYRHFIRGSIFDVTPEGVWRYSNLYYNSADLDTAPAASTKREMEANGSTVDIRVVSNGIDPAQFDNSGADELRRKYGLKGMTVLYLGRISQDKNILELIRMFFSVAARLPEARLLLVGDGPQAGEARTLAESRREGRQIIFAGAIPHDELTRSGVFGACELFATASETENQPLTVLEALANGMPCLGYAVRGIPDLVLDGRNGCVIEPGRTDLMAEAAVHILTNPSLRRRYSEGARDSIAPHLIPAVIDAWEDIYRETISRFSRGDFPAKDRLHLTRLLGMLKEIQITMPGHSLPRHNTLPGPTAVTGKEREGQPRGKERPHRR